MPAAGNACEYAHRGTVANMHIARCIVAMHASCTWNYGRGAAEEVMRAHLL